MFEKLILVFQKAYEMVIQFGYACWSTSNEGFVQETITNASVFNEMLGKTGSFTISTNSFLYGSIHIFYSLVCGIFTDVGNVGVNIINWVVKIFGGESLIPFIAFNDLPMIVGIVLAIPFWIGLIAIIKLLFKVLGAIPFV